MISKKRTYQQVNCARCHSFQEVMDLASCILLQESALLFICTLLAPLHRQSHIAKEAICWCSIQWTLSNCGFWLQDIVNWKKMETVIWWVKGFENHVVMISRCSNIAPFIQTLYCGFISQSLWPNVNCSERTEFHVCACVDWIHLSYPQEI